MTDEETVRILTPEEMIESIKRATNSSETVPFVEPLPDRYVHFSFGAGHEMMFNIRLPESKLTDVFFHVERFFDKWLAVHQDGEEEGNGSGPRSKPAGVPYHG